MNHQGNDILGNQDRIQGKCLPFFFSRKYVHSVFLKNLLSKGISVCSQVICSQLLH